MRIGAPSTEDDTNFQTELLGLILMELGNQNVNLSVIEGDYLNDLGLIIEAANSLIKRYHGRKHPLQYVARTLFEKQGGGVITINENMSYIGVDLTRKG